MMTPYKDLISLIEKISRRHGTSQVFSDFVEMSAISISNSVDKKHFDEREMNYMNLIKRYSKEEITLFPEMFVLLVAALENKFDDVLGKLFMELDLGNAKTGQFFTPYHICQLMTQISTIDAKEIIEKNGFISLSEPCVGGGAMVISAAEELLRQNINYQQHMHVIAIDVDSRAVHMAYLQLALYNIPAIIIHGNALSLKEYSRWYTPAHVMGNWEIKLGRQNQDTERQEISLIEIPAPALVQESSIVQLGLF